MKERMKKLTESKDENYNKKKEKVWKGTKKWKIMKDSRMKESRWRRKIIKK